LETFYLKQQFMNSLVSIYQYKDLSMYSGRLFMLDNNVGGYWVDVQRSLMANDVCCWCTMQTHSDLDITSVPLSITCQTFIFVVLIREAIVKHCCKSNGIGHNYFIANSVKWRRLNAFAIYYDDATSIA